MAWGGGRAGRGVWKELICIQNSDPFRRHLHKDGGERRGEDAGMASERREQDGVNRCRKKREL